MLSKIFDLIAKGFSWLVTDEKVDQAVRESESSAELVRRLAPILIMAALGAFLASKSSTFATAGAKGETRTKNPDGSETVESPERKLANGATGKGRTNIFSK